jgi:chromosomal replication initiator protein
LAQRRVQTTTSDVIDAVTRHYEVEERELKGRQRTKAIVLPRQVAMYLLREETDISLEEIGRSMGGRDHTTVLHGIKKIESALENDVQLRAAVMAIRESLFTTDD